MPSHPSAGCPDSVFLPSAAPHGFLIDMDGVIYRGSELIPGADRFIAELLARDLPFFFSSSSPTTASGPAATWSWSRSPNYLPPTSRASPPVRSRDARRQNEPPPIPPPSMPPPPSAE